MLTAEQLVDFHCHLDLYADYRQMILETERACIRTLAVTTTPRAWPHNRDLTKDMKYVRPALGFHPQLVGRSTHEDLELWDKYLPEARFIGEVGLDAGPAFYRTLDKQKIVLEHILKACAKSGDKLLSVHAVRSVGTLLDMAEALMPSVKRRIVLHWFSGTASEARRAVKLGCYFSINQRMIDTERGRALVKTISLDRLLTETDGPFIGDERPNKPSDVGQCVVRLGEVVEMEQAAITKMIGTNLNRLLES
jgi:TatD DNase family protein